MISAAPVSRAGSTAGADVCFLVHTYRDFDDLVLCVSRLRRVYPAAVLIVVVDGGEDDRCLALATPGHYTSTTEMPPTAAAGAAAATRVIFGERLFGAESGGEIVHRMFELYLAASQASYLIKIDTDTHVHRRFRWLPDVECCFGTLQTARRGGVSVQGGCMGFTRQLAAELLQSGVFLDKRLKIRELAGETKNLDSWVRNEAMRRRVEDEGLTSIDWVVAHVARKCHPFRFVDFPEVRCLYRRFVQNADLRYAVTHPCLEKARRHGYPTED